MEALESAATIACASSVSTFSLAVIPLSTLVTRVVLQVTAATDGRTTSAQGFLLGNRGSLRELRFR